jgi:uncharacterized protein
MTSQENIRDLSHNLKKLFDEMWETFSSYQASAGLPCITGCGQCCLNPEVDASTLEMIPIALKIFDDGKLEEWLEKTSTPTQEHCLFYVQGIGPWQGYCGIYQERPALCRMFGVAGYLNKDRDVTLSICKHISQKYPVETLAAKEKAKTERVPVFATWTTLVSGLGTPELNQRYPINEALKRALHKISILAQYEML